ncbi:MAG: bifunctional (p)ppGpp synthetase/guanosine-3',5'-bis(diphosphate) 3'-pyrophosphohydrolase [Propionibacteriaceae bacterium]|jgi:GTP pyrophosphokinase|nr:bifunctional (p)ppGpp synthetase/guanosine-3',5'-bis(diphosphate) 3'-pyrophosphohydrolase [Propionibacteriaceae bacterium]
MRQMFEMFGSKKTTPPELEPLFTALKEHNKNADTELIEKAYRVASHWHEGQTRKNGDPYITHPIAVATIVASLGMNEATIAAALLHDTVEDTPYTLEQLSKDFTPEIARMVDGVTKLDKIQYGESAKTETIRKMVLAMSKDIRVLVIKLADRLHNMRTLKFMRQDRQLAIARETLDIFAPLAHRLGMNTIKWELEDLAFSTLEPKIYHEIVKMVAERAPLREESLHVLIGQVKADLDAAGIQATVYGRPKHYYSIYQKMVVRGRDFDEIYDLIGLRILVNNTRECYAALGVLHSRWTPIPGRFKDYIAMPKFNLYQSLHTTVSGPGGKAVEFQIRTHEMHKQAEYGVAAHWKYKEGVSSGAEIDWVRQVSEWQKETDDPGDFLDSLRYEVNNDDVFVFTPKGDIMSLPAGSTPVDFAYSVHTQVGHKCIGARVNGKLVPLESELVNGDSVEVLVSKSETAGPSRDWLGFVKSAKARNKIRQYFNREAHEENVETGKDRLNIQMRKAGLPIQRVMSHERVADLVEHFKVKDIEALYASIGDNTISAQSVVNRIIASEGGHEGVADIKAEDTDILGSTRPAKLHDSGAIVQGDPSLLVKLARCCLPVPGDEIIGFVTRGDGVSVHRKDCTNAKDLMSRPERIVPVEWAPTADSAFLVALHIEGIDRTGVLTDVSKVFADQKISIISANMSTSQDRVFSFRLTFEVTSQKHLEHIINVVKRIPGVYEAYRLKQ